MHSDACLANHPVIPSAFGVEVIALWAIHLCKSKLRVGGCVCVCVCWRGKGGHDEWYGRGLMLHWLDRWRWCIYIMYTRGSFHNNFLIHLYNDSNATLWLNSCAMICRRASIHSLSLYNHPQWNNLSIASRENLVKNSLKKWAGLAWEHLCRRPLWRKIASLMV